MVNAKTDSRIFIFVSLCLVSLIIGVYFQTIQFDFVGYDDELYVTENHIVQKGVSLEGIKWAFTTFHSANWHPLTWLSHMLDYELYGLNPAGHHWTNVEFHIANTLLLFFILFKMTGAVWRSAFVAALFALHPLHVESVAWVSERKDVLSTFFGLLTVVAYSLYVKKSSIKYYILVFAFLSIGLMAKPMLVTLPFVLLLLDFWPLKRFQFDNLRPSQSDEKIYFYFKGSSYLILEKIPLLIPVVISCILTFFAQKSEGAVKALESLSLTGRIANAFVSYINYVLKAIWPHKLAIFYPHPGDTLPAWKIIGAAFLITCACFLAIRAAKKYPYIVFGLFWYLGTLVPVIGLVQVGEQAMADRYTYIPLIGVFIIVVWGILDLFNKRFRDRRSEVGGQGLEISSVVLDPFNQGRFQKILMGIFATIILAALSWTTFLQLRYWKNGVTLFEHAVKVTERNHKAHNNLAIALGPIDIDRAIFHYKEALRIHPKYVTALCNLGLAFYNKGNHDEAVSYFTKALKINPQKTATRMDRANVLFLQAKHEKAISEYRDILKIDSENANAHFNLACMLDARKKVEQAEYHYNETLRIDPKYSNAHYNFGNILLSQGKIKEAVIHFVEAIKIKPDFVQAYNKLGLILLKQRKFKKADFFFSKALEIDPGFSEARANLDIVRKRMSK